MIDHLLIFHESFQYLMINKDLNEKFYINKFKTLIFKKINNNQ